MGQRIILHVGLHKTGTTFLQDRVFPALEGVRFLALVFVESPVREMPDLRRLPDAGDDGGHAARGIDIVAHRSRLHLIEHRKQLPAFEGP